MSVILVILWYLTKITLLGSIQVYVCVCKISQTNHDMKSATKYTDGCELWQTVQTLFMYTLLYRSLIAIMLGKYFLSYVLSLIVFNYGSVWFRKIAKGKAKSNQWDPVKID